VGCSIHPAVARRRTELGGVSLLLESWIGTAPQQMKEIRDKKKEEGLTEDEADNEPAGVVDAVGGRGEGGAVEHDGQVDKLELGVREPALPEPERDGGERADEHCPPEKLVDALGAELAGGSDEAPVHTQTQHKKRKGQWCCELGEKSDGRRRTRLHWRCRRRGCGGR
jgi:hypothetical protein